jgi:short-subunit dehydrogenase
MRRFDGKTVLITGASSGIGESLGREFAGRGAAVVLTARRKDRLDTLATGLEAAGHPALAVACDVTRDGDLEAAVAAAVERFGHLDVAVANAGFGVPGNIADLGLDDFRRQFETNVFGVLRTLYAALPELRRNRGTLVLIGSVSGHVATPGTAAYAMSKFAVRALALALRSELRREGVKVVLVSPGFVDSEIRKIDRQGRVHENARDPIPAWLRMPSDEAARKIANATARGSREAVVTLHGKLLVLLSRLAPAMVQWLAEQDVGRRHKGKR